MKSSLGKRLTKVAKTNGIKRREPRRKKTPEWIAAAERAFRRVARAVRAENKRWGLPVLVWNGGKIRKVKSMNNSTSIKKELSPKQRQEQLKALKARFDKSLNRHKGLEWAKVQTRLEASVEKLWSLSEMERTGGEPDVVGQDKKTREYIFFDCSAESPKGRVSVCYDREGLDSRKEHKPKDTAVDMAVAMGIELLTEAEYLELQKLGDFDTKTSSWVKTPAEIRELGGALYCDRRYGRVFVGHNGAQSYYAARGFRGVLRV